jgi:hypothetical protein
LERDLLTELALDFRLAFDLLADLRWDLFELADFFLPLSSFILVVLAFLS